MDPIVIDRIIATKKSLTKFLYDDLADDERDPEWVRLRIMSAMSTIADNRNARRAFLDGYFEAAAAREVSP